MFYLLVVIFTGQLFVSDTYWKEEAEGYRIEVQFPEIVLENEYIDKLLKDSADGRIREFKQLFKAHSLDDPFILEWALELNFFHQPSPDDMACIVLSQWEYTGGAHGNSFTQSFNFDLNSSSLITTLDLLGGENQFQLFANSVIEYLKNTEVDETWVERGASADIQNYHTVFPVPGEDGSITGYTVIFPPYQVACYAVGSVEVFIGVQSNQ